jgi:hypothetical protein
MPNESYLVKTMAQGAGSGRRAGGGLTAGQEREKTTERSNLHKMPAGTGNRLPPRALLIISAKPTPDKKMKKVKIFKTITVALLSSLLIGVASMPARSATVADKATVVEKMPTKGGVLSPLRIQSPVDESRVASAAREGLTNCKPSNLYSDGIVGDPESCIMGDRLSIGGDIPAGSVDSYTRTINPSEKRVCARGECS